MFLEVRLISLKHAVKPREKLLSTVIGMQDNGNAIDWRNATDVVSRSNGTSNGTFLLGVGETLSCEKGTTPLRYLNYDRGFIVARGLETSNNR